MFAAWLLVPVLAAAAQNGAASSQPTPGATALLVGRDDGGLRAALAQAIGSPDPVVRAVAARVAGVRRAGDMAGPLRAALAVETDPVARREQQAAIGRLERDPVAAPPQAAAAPLAVRTFPLIAPGLLSSLMQTTGCKPDKDASFGAARLTFDASGAVTRSEINTSRLPRKCADVLATMSRLTTADEGTGTHAEYLLLPIDYAFAACADADFVPADPPPPPNASRTPPRKILDVKPQYPERALRSGIQGTVFIAAHVTRSGCINDARVTRGIDPELDFAALRAVVQWTFEPARLNGAPIPIVMTVTVSFNRR
jgi:TonB family protein